MTPRRKTKRGAPAERAGGQGRQRERAALAVVVGAQQDQHVFQRDDDDQRPQDQRQHAEYDIARDGVVVARRDRRLAEGVERAGADIAVDDADAAERQRREAGRRRARVIGSLGLGGSRAFVHAITH